MDIKEYVIQLTIFCLIPWSHYDKLIFNQYLFLVTVEGKLECVLTNMIFLFIIQNFELFYFFTLVLKNQVNINLIIKLFMFYFFLRDHNENKPLNWLYGAYIPR